MARDEEIRAAELAVIETARKWVSGAKVTGPIADAVRKLDALRSPLPSLEGLKCVVRHPDADNGLPLSSRLVEACGPFWLRWVAKISGHHEEPSDIHADADMPWGGSCFYCWIKERADELEARANGD